MVIWAYFDPWKVELGEPLALQAWLTRRVHHSHVNHDLQVLRFAYETKKNFTNFKPKTSRIYFQTSLVEGFTKYLHLVLIQLFAFSVFTVLASMSACFTCEHIFWTKLIQPRCECNTKSTVTSEGTYL